MTPLRDLLGTTVARGTAHVARSSDTTAILFTRVQMTGPTPTPLMRQFWRVAFDEL